MSVLTKLGGEIAWIALKELIAHFKEQRANLTPEEKAKWDSDWVKEFQVGE